MPSLSPSWFELFAVKIADCPLEALARTTGFLRRRSKKITPAGFLRTACLFALQNGGSLAGFAQLWALQFQQTLSKQAVQKRFCQTTMRFMEAVLQSVLAGLIQPAALPSLWQNRFGRILLQDSTCLSLPLKLAALFPGGTNQHHRRQAGLKIQATLDLLKNQWTTFQLTPATVNDQKASPEILSTLRPGDLLIRDLGYLVLDVLRQIEQKGAYFLSRWRYGIQVFADPAGKPMSLLSCLRESGPVWEQSVWLGKEKLPVRLIAVRLPAAVAAQRRRKARYNHDRLIRHSVDYFELLGWNILFTNAPATLLSAAEVVELYSLRWRIETVFKAWKTHFRLNLLTEVSLNQLLVILLGKLIWICWFSIQWTNLAATGLQVSLLKLAHWSAQLATVFCLPGHQFDPQFLRTHLSYYCCYEKRKDRRNFLQKCAGLG